MAQHRNHRSLTSQVPFRHTKSITNTALITGASGGIGEELAKIFAANGFHLVLIARSEEKLRQLAGTLNTKVLVLPEDLADPDAPARIVEKLNEQSIEIEVLVNNAAFGARGAFAEIDPRIATEIVQVNIAALTLLTRLLLPPMIRRGHGRLLNVASTAAYVPGPFMAEYYASKAYVLSLTEALSNELKGTGVTATALCPGPTRTGFDARAGATNTKLFRGEVMDAARVAREGFEGLMQGKRVIIPGIKNRWPIRLSRIVPRNLLARVTRRLNSSPS